MAIGVFGLQVAYRLKRLEVMSTDDTHGWFGGGLTASLGIISNVDRIDFSNDTGTANIRGPLTIQRYNLTATGNSNYGWFGGGNEFSTPTQFSRVDRIDFSNDSATAEARGPLSFARNGLKATGNSNYGWFGGGIVPAPTATVSSRVDRIDFSNDSTTLSPRGPLSSSRYSHAATGNSNYGWFGSGFVNFPLTVLTVDRIDFSNDLARTSVRGPLSLARSELVATGNSNYGWFGGGGIPGQNLSIVDRIDFSNDLTIASVRGPLRGQKRYVAATGNSNYGWFGGGSGSVLFAIDEVDLINFSNDLVSSSVRGPLSAARNGLAATSGQAKGPAIKLQKGGNFGWFGGGTVSPPTTTEQSTVNRIDFSNDSSTASPRGLLSAARYSFAATGNSNYGWFGGGQTFPSGNPALSRVDRIDFSNDSSTASIRGPLSLARNSLSATGNSNYGWFGGGSNPATLAVDRIDFSNDLAIASPRGPLTSSSPSKHSTTATGNSNYGWWGGGFNGTLNVSTVDRIDFSNDAATASIRGPLRGGKNSIAATGNSNYGWFGGGFDGAIPASFSSIDRIDFSNDSISAILRGLLNAPAGRSSGTATGNSNYGWFGGGFPGLSIVDRINFSNDSVTASVRGLLLNGSPGRHNLAATSNTPI